MARRLLTTAVPLLTRRPPTPALSTIPRRHFALNSSGTQTAASSMTGQSPAGGANNQAAGSSTGINATQQGQKMASPHSTQPAGDKDVTQRPATSSPTGGAGLGVGEKSMNSEMAGSYQAQADKQGGQLGQGMGDKHSNEVHKDRASGGVVPGTGNATSGDETIGGTGNAGSQDAGTSMDKASRGSKGSNAGGKTPATGGSSGKRGFATKAGGANSGASSSTGNTMSTSGIGSAPTSASKSSNGSGSGSSAGSSGSSTASKTASNAGSSTGSGATSSSSGSGGAAKSNLGTSASSGASTTNSTNSPGMGGAGSAGSSTSSGSATGKSNTSAGGKSDTAHDNTTVESNSGQGGGVGSTGSPRVGGSAGGGAARANTGEHSPSGTAGGVATGGTTTMESVKEKVRDYTGDVSASMPAASSYTVIAAVLLGVPILFVLDPDRAYLKKQHMEREKEIQEEYH